jgi:hypothetical protein
VANKGSKGLPPGFDLDIPSQSEGPVKLGDYLDEVEAPTPAPKPVPQRRADDSKVIELPRQVQTEPEQPPADTSTKPQAAATEVRTKKRRRKPKGPVRKQINATPETIRMIEELLDHVQTYSVQKDARASEVFHALVLALYEAREFIELGEIPPRGRWGTPTAKAFPISLKNAFQEAIATAYKRHKR